MIDRRSLIGGMGIVLLAGSARAAPGLQPTPPQTEGPYFPPVKPVDQDADLTRIAGRSGRARGELVEVHGRLLRRDGSPASGGMIELWQANAAGRYLHPNDRSPAPLDRDFQGYARIRTGADGRFRLLTVKPGSYPLAGMVRTPHIHFRVVADDRRLTTQMYFPDEPLNASDSVLSSTVARGGDPRLLVARAVGAGSGGARRLEWQIVV